MKQLLIAFDQFINVFFYSKYDKENYDYAFGMADETLSARAYRLRKHSKKWKAFQVSLDVIFFWDKGEHSFKSYRNEFRRKQLPSYYRNR